MTEKEIWKEFISKNKTDHCEYEAWSFGAEADLLAKKVVCEEFEVL